MPTYARIMDRLQLQRSMKTMLLPSLFKRLPAGRCWRTMLFPLLPLSKRAALSAGRLVRHTLLSLVLLSLLLAALTGCSTPLAEQAEQGRTAAPTTLREQEEQGETAAPTTLAEQAEQGGTAAPTTLAETESAETPLSTAPADALQGGKVTMGITQEPDFLDPCMAVAAGTKEILFNIYEGLVKLDHDGKLMPALATDWQFSEDGLSITFTLREGVKFHDGKTMDAGDVVASLRRAAGLGAKDAVPMLPQLANIRSVEATEDEKKVVLHMKKPSADMIYFLTVAITPADAGDLNKEPVGTGPFRFVEYVPQDHLTLARFADYRSSEIYPEEPYLDEVTFRIYDNMDAAYLELLSGQIDLFPYLTAEKASGLEEQYSIQADGANMLQLLALNNARVPFDQPEVREALECAVDRQQLIELIMGRYGRPVYSGMTPSMGSYYNEKLAEQVAARGRDVAKARALLAKAGYADGLSFTATVPSNYLIHVDSLNVLVAQFAEAGIEVRLEPVEWGTWLERVYQGRDYQATIIALTYEYAPSDVLDRFMSENPNNFINYSNVDYDKIAEEADSTTDTARRRELYQSLQKNLYENHASLFLQEPFNITAVKKGLAGYVQYPAYVQDMASVYYTDAALRDASLNR